MIKKIGKFLFRYRNMLAPLLFILAAVVGRLRIRWAALT